MKKVFILLGFALLGGGAFGEVLSNGPANGNAYGCQVYGCKSVLIEMVFVEGGTLSSSNSGLNGKAVGSFYIGKYEVTQKLWLEVMGTTINDMYAQRTLSSQGLVGVGDDYPMYFVSWNDAQKFVAALNALNGGGNKFRLPTEAEWEYAAKGGNPQQSYTYAGSNTIDDVAWYYDNSAVSGTRQTHPVNDNAKLANGIGAYHMSGNVGEWCEDLYSSSGSNRMGRGGSWGTELSLCPMSYRFNDPPDNRGNFSGFRLACSSNP
jgi:formylglycine-generating enzyme required for sulfatase activity